MNNRTAMGDIMLSETGGLPPGVAKYFRWKRWISPVVAAVLLVPGVPVIAVLAALVRLTSQGPGIYRQRRVGVRGKTFTMYKIRTMHVDAENRGPQWTRDADPRITPVGRMLRKLHLDELPQLLNVLRGEMDLIGPRPERPEFTRVLAAEIPGYLDRLQVRPGITGLAQINLPADSDLNSVRRKLALDLRYIATASLLLDVRVLLATGLRLWGRSIAVPAENFDMHARSARRQTFELASSKVEGAACRVIPAGKRMR